ncbi:MAG: hypothetical protein AB1643_02480 [Patescibacteria group bacterium]
MNYKNWPKKEIPIIQLFLDPLNPRISDKFEKATQTEVIQELVKRHNILKLANEIVKNKDYPELERYIAIEEDGKLLILEGNRRLAAYKCLIDPGIAPESVREKFKKLAAQASFDGSEKLEVFIAPSRTDALPVLESKHVRYLFEPWSMAMRNNFVKRTKTKTKGVLKADEKKNIARANLYELAKNLELPEQVSQIVQDHKKFNITTFYRIVESSVGKKFLGYDLNEKGDVIPYIHPAEFLKGLKRIVSDVALEKVNSRLISKTIEIEKKYLDKIEKKDRPNLARVVKKKLKVGGQVLTQPTKPKKTKLQTDWITSDNYLLYPKQNRIKEILNELKSMKPEDSPNTCAISLRVLLELSTYAFLENKGEIKKMVTAEKKKRKKAKQNLPNDWTPTFKQMLQHLMSSGYITDPQLRRSFSLHINKNSTQPFLVELDQFVHNLHYKPTATDVRNIWRTFGLPLFEITSK